MSWAIQIQNVSKRYGQRLAVHNLTLEVAEGEMFGFLGPNGAGKTTTIRLLLGLLRPDRGKVNLLGCDLANERAGVEVKSSLGFLPDIAQLDRGFTGGDWLRYLAALQVPFDPARQRGLLERLQLSQAELQRKVSTYSRGMRQKLAIVQALQHQPRLIILDEPTEGLDPLAKHSLFELLVEAQAQGATIFFSSHVLSEVERLCDRVALIRSGELVTVDSIVNLRGQLARRVELIFKPDQTFDAVRLSQALAVASGLPDQSLGNLAETAAGMRWRFEWRGEPGPLLKILDTAPLTLVDLVIEPANLEDVFLHYYQK